MNQLIFGGESEYAFVALDEKGRPIKDALDEVDRICASSIAHLPGLERGIVLPSGGNWYREAAGGHTHDEYSTPEVSSPDDAVLHTRAGDLFARRAAAIYRQRKGVTEAYFSRHNVDYSSEPASWGFHDNFCTRNNPASLAPLVIGHLASRICYTGSGAFDHTSPGLDFVVSGRAMFTNCVSSGSTESRRGLFHEDYKSPHGHGGLFRMHVIVGDSLNSQRGLWLRIATTALVVGLADAGFKAGASTRFPDPLYALKIFTGDANLEAVAKCADGRSRTAIGAQREYLAHVERHLDHLPAWAPAVVSEWRRVLDALENPATGGMGRTLDWAIKHRMFTDLLAARGLSWADVSGRSKKKCAATQRIRAEFMLLDSNYFSRLDADGIFESLDALPGVLDHRVPGITERLDWALDNPPGDTRARLRGEAVRRFAGTARGARMRAGWSEVTDGATNLDLSNPFACDLAPLDRWSGRTAADSSAPGTERSGRRLAGRREDEFQF